MSDEKTMNQRAIEKLEEEIKTDKESIKAKREMLDLLKDAEATPFSETKVARGFFHTVKFLTSPFAKLHQVHQEVLEDPEGYRRKKLTENSSVILEKAEKLVNGDKEANGIATICAKQVVRMEDELRRGPWPQGEITIGKLRDQVEYLRSAESKERRDEMRKTLEVVTEPGEAPDPQPA